MYLQLINITSRNVFRKYSQIYNIFRELYEVGSFGLEISEINSTKAEEINKLFLKNGDFCYTKKISENKSNLIAIGSIHKFKENAKLVNSQVNEEIGFRMMQTLTNYEMYDKNHVMIGGKKFENCDVHIMGILNITPDSFSDGGNYFIHENAIKHAINMIKTGADIIDVGGESTRPNAEIVTESDELKRVLPVIQKLHTLHPDVVISIDTTKSKVADAALEAGATMVNDISSATFDKNMLETVAKHNAALVLMHMQGTPQNMQVNPHYDDVLKEIGRTLDNAIKRSIQADIKNIIIDPGFGFGKELNHNFEILERLAELKSLGYPIMAGLSNKSMLGNSLELEVADRENASIVAETIAVQNGARFIRTHNVKNAYQLKNLYKFVNNPGTLQNV